LALALGEDEREARIRCERALRDGTALQKFAQIVEAQGGDPSCVKNPERLPTASTVYEIRANKDGYVFAMDCALIGKTATLLGAGREKKGDSIDLSAGIMLAKKTGDYVHAGEALAFLHTNRVEKLGEAEWVYREALTFSDVPPEKEPLVYKII
jgi:pyrimidine-nucleoside phosphorylase